MRILRSVRFLLLVFVMLAIPATSFAQFGIAITIAPPPLVVYSQPICPQEGYLWTPGYWAYGPEGYFWVPGTWVEPPTVGFLWTPGYWGWGGGGYAWNAGYWGPTVGFYGGVNYGYGYGGNGYEGGYWRNNRFSYNRAVNNVDRRNFHNTYEKSVSSSRAGNGVSYNGGNGGTRARETAAQQNLARGRHDPATAAQTGHQQAASENHELLNSVNHGRPPVAATSRPGEFTGNGAVAPRGNAAAASEAATTRTNNNRAATNEAAATRTNDSGAAANEAATTRANNNRAAANEAATTRANNAAEKRSVENNAAATRANNNRAAANEAATTRSNNAAEKRSQPAPSHVNSNATRSESQPTRTNNNSQQSHQSAPREQSAPRAAPEQHQSAPKQQSPPKSHESNSEKKQ